MAYTPNTVITYPTIITNGMLNGIVNTKCKRLFVITTDPATNETIQMDWIVLLRTNVRLAVMKVLPKPVIVDIGGAFDNSAGLI